jgi:hypothetical protein
MTQKKCTGRRINLQEVFSGNKDSFKELLREVNSRQKVKQLNFNKVYNRSLILHR